MSKRGSIAALRAQCRATFALLPFVTALDFDEQLLVRIFGSTMGVLNWLPDSERLEREIESQFAEFEVPIKKPKSREEQRAYWRRQQREYRANKASEDNSYD